MAKEYTRRVHVISQIPFPGEPILADNFEGVFNWGIGGTGADFEGYKSPENPLFGSYSLYMITKATTPAIGDYVQAIRYGHAVASRFIEFTFSFAVSLSAPDYGYLDGWLDVIELSTGDRVRYKIRLNYDDLKLQYESASGVFTDIADLGAIQGNYNKFRMILDQKNRKIKSFETGDKEFEVDKSGFLAATSQAAGIDVGIRVETRTANRASVYIDNVVIKGVEE